MNRAAAWWALARPKGTFWVGTLPLLGYGFAHWNYGLQARVPEYALLAVVLWWMLSAGALWLNAALDQDEDETLFGRSVTVPDGSATAGLGLLAVTCGISSVLGPIPFLCMSGCAALAVVYSHPALAWKGHPLGGPFVNAMGYGILSPAAGYSLVGVPVDVRAAGTVGVLVALVMGMYFAAQAFQGPADAARGYRTLVATHGAHGALSAARWAFAIAGGQVAIWTLVGGYPRSCVLALPLWFSVDRWLVEWSGRAGGGSEADARVLVRRVMLAGFTLIGACFGQYVWNVAHGEAPAGLGTAWVPR